MPLLTELTTAEREKVVTRTQDLLLDRGNGREQLAIKLAALEVASAHLVEAARKAENQAREILCQCCASDETAAEIASTLHSALEKFRGGQ